MPTRPAHHPLARHAADATEPPAVLSRQIQPRPAASEPDHRWAVDPDGDRARPPVKAGDRLRSVAADRGPVESGPGAGQPLPAHRCSPERSQWRDETGSVATEYGLLAVVAATIVSVVLDWATGGGILALLQSVLARVSTLVGL